MPSQLNGKRAPAAIRRSGSTALPPQRYGGRRRASSSRRQLRRTCHWRREPSGRSPRSLRQPGYRPTSGPRLVRGPCRSAAAGKRSPASCGNLHHVHCLLEAPPSPRLRRARVASLRRLASLRCAFLVSISLAHRRPRRRHARRRSSSPARASPRRSAAARADIVVIDADDDPQHAAPIRSRTCSGATPACSSCATAARARTPGFFIRGASTNSTVVLIDGVRIGSATLGQAEFEALSLAQIDRIEVLRGPASSLYGADAVGGVVQIFTRRGAGAAALERRRRGRRLSLGTRRRRRERRAGRWDYALSLGHEQSRGVSAIAPGDPFGSFNPDRDGFRRDFGNAAARLHAGAGTPHRRAPARDAPAMRSSTRPISRRRLRAGSVARLPQSPDDARRLRSTTAARRCSAWTTTLQASRAVDDLTSGGTTPSRFVTRARAGDVAERARARRRSAARARLRAPARARRRATRSRASSTRRNDAGVLGYSGRFGAQSLQADLRRDDNSAYGGNTTGRLGYAIELGAGVKAARARRHDLSRADLQRPLLSRLRRRDDPARARPQHRGRATLAGRPRRALSATVYRNRVRDLIGFQPDRSVLSGRPGVRLRLRRERRTGAPARRDARRRAGAGAASTCARASICSTRATPTPACAWRAAPRTRKALGADYAAGAWRSARRPSSSAARPDDGVVLGGYGVVDLRVRLALPAAAGGSRPSSLNALDRTRRAGARLSAASAGRPGSACATRRRGL